MTELTAHQKLVIYPRISDGPLIWSVLQPLHFEDEHQVTELRLCNFLVRIVPLRDINRSELGDQRPTLQPVRGVPCEPSLPIEMRRARGEEAFLLTNRFKPPQITLSSSPISTRRESASEPQPQYFLQIRIPYNRISI